MRRNKPIYILDGYYDTREECYGPCTLTDEDDYLEAIYYSLYKYDHPKYIDKKKMKEFEMDKIIIENKDYVSISDAKQICNEELENPDNKTVDDFIKAVNKRINELSTTNDPEYKERQLLNRINELYNKVKGELIRKEILYNGKFLQTIKEIYRLPNKKIVEKEKVVKNSGKDSVIIVSKTDDEWPNEKYILVFQQRVNNIPMAEFPSGYIEPGETPIEAAKRELLEETGYEPKYIGIIEEAYTSPGIDNSKTYILLATECKKTTTPSNAGTEYVNYDIFDSKELDYMFINDIIGGAMNKLAYNAITNKNIYSMKNRNIKKNYNK